MERHPTSGEEVIYLKNPPANHAGWIDATDPNDPYPPEMWSSFMKFVEVLAVSDCTRLDIGGGRYAKKYANKQKLFVTELKKSYMC